MRTRTVCNSACSSRSRLCRQLALGGPADHLLRQANVLGFALLLLCGSRLELRFQLGQLRRNLRHHRLDALHRGHGSAAALFQCGQLRPSFAGELRRFITAQAQAFQTAVRRLHLQFKLTLLFFLRRQLSALLRDERLLLVTFLADAAEFPLVGGEPFAHPDHLGFELAEGVARSHGLALAFALVVLQPMQQSGQLEDFAAQRGHAQLFGGHGALHLAHLLQHFAQFALHGERSLAALLAAGHGDVVEALARLGEEEGIGIIQREIAAGAGIGHNVAVAELGQNHFKRFAEAVEHANAMLERDHAVAMRDLVRGLVEEERKLRLRIFGMDQERRAAIHVAAQQAQTFVGRVPRLHHDVVQLVAQEIVNHVLIAIFHFEKVGEHAHRRKTFLHRARGEELAHRFGGVAMLGDDGFQRTPLAHRAGVLATQRIQMALAGGFGGALFVELLARFVDLRGERDHAL